MAAGLTSERYAEVVQRRRAFALPGYKTLAELGFDGPWVTPLQMEAGSLTGPVLIAFNWLDPTSIEQNRVVLEQRGHLPRATFNVVLNAALQAAGLKRGDVYLTQAFHLLPGSRSGGVREADVQASFDAITQHEIAGRPVVGLGHHAARACRRRGVSFTPAPHPSARGSSFDDKARSIAQALKIAVE